jgi:hypothetical protein
MNYNLQRPTIWITRIAMLAALIVAGSGCVTFRGGQVAKMEKPEKLSNPIVNKVQVRLLVTRNGAPVPANFEKQIMEAHSKLLMRAIVEGGMFGDVEVLPAGTTLKPGEYVLKYDVDNWGSEGWAAVSGFICGLTLTAIPGAATDHFTVRTEVLDRAGNRCWKKTYEDKMTCVIWIGFLPCIFVPPCYPTSVLDKTMVNIYRASLNDMRVNKVFAPPIAATPPPVSNVLPAASSNNPQQP